MYHFYDPDEYESVVKSEYYGEICGVPQGSITVTQRRRNEEEVRKIKAEKQRQFEAAILAQAELILNRRR